MITIPDTIARYQRAGDDQDIDAIVTCFTGDATVIDEGNTYRGHGEIRTWREGVASTYTYTSTVVDVRKVADDTYAIVTDLRGDFPGGEATVTNTFTLAGDHISALTIG